MAWVLDTIRPFCVQPSTRRLKVIAAAQTLTKYYLRKKHGRRANDRECDGTEKRGISLASPAHRDESHESKRQCHLSPDEKEREEDDSCWIWHLVSTHDAMTVVRGTYSWKVSPDSQPGKIERT